MTTTTTQPPVDIGEHIFRSIRGWLHQLYPTLPIYLERKQAAEASSRPAFVLELIDGPSWEEFTAGANWVRATFQIGYAADPSSDSGMWDSVRVVGAIRSASTRPGGRIPLSLYNFPWPQQPNVDVAATVGGSLPALLDLAVSGVAVDGTASAPCAVMGLAVPAGDTLTVTPRNWPSGAPLADSWRLYAAVSGQPLQLQASGSGPFVLAALASGAAPPSNQRLSFRGLRVDGMDATTKPTSSSEGLFDALVTLRVRAVLQRAYGAQLADPLIP